MDYVLFIYFEHLNHYTVGKAFILINIIMGNKQS